ncbi:MAG: GNAT family N-acetyltransferase [Flavobacteriales bacterium]|nr:GNAT family N-acetyltransferase [Flavobacteriales bacterium]
MQSIETSRLILRPFTLDDVEAAYTMNLDEDVSRYTGDGGVMSFEEIERRIREDVMGDYARHGFGRFAVEWRETGAFIGFTGLKYLVDMDEVDLGYRFMSNYWGMGIATEAGKACIEFGFKELGLERIIAMLLIENQSSIRVLEKLGFQFEKSFIEDGLIIQQYAIGQQIL